MLNTTPAPRRSAALVALALALVWSLLVAVPARAQVPEACDANGDANPTGTTQSLLTSGSDEVASQLAADTGVVLGPAPRAQRWRVSVCVESGPEGEAPTRSVIGSPTTELAPEAGAWETAALAQALDELAPQLYRPGARTSPHVDGVLELAQQLPGLIGDPGGFVSEKLSVAKDLYAAITAAPGAFASEFFDLETLGEEPGRWAGRIGCEIALALLTGGAASKRIADLIADSDKLADFARRFGGRDRDRNRDRDGDGGDTDDGLGACPARSFGARTRVVMANGTLRPISEVRVGELVLARDPSTDESGARQVLATMRHADQLLTLATSAGDIVTTEDHRYWNATDGQWQQSQVLDPGDRLLTPDGDEVLVEGLDWSTVHTASAYDLEVDEVPTFFVFVGEDAVLVHNACIRDLDDFMDTSPDDLVVLGRQTDTSVAQDWPGHQVLDLESWSPAKNRQFIEAMIERRQTVYVGSPLTAGNLQGTVFGSEIDQMISAGYRFSDDRLSLLPPGS